MDIIVDVQNATEDEDVPDHPSLLLWCQAALATQDISHAEICIRFIDKQESQTLNNTYRQQNKATNVLSFPSQIPNDINSTLSHPLLGDLAICTSIVIEEAKIQKKTTLAHWAHMVIHGSLHLLGFDHIQNNEAEVMETLEADILNSLGYSNPYSNPYSNFHDNSNPSI